MADRVDPAHVARWPQWRFRYDAFDVPFPHQIAGIESKRIVAVLTSLDAARRARERLQTLVQVEIFFRQTFAGHWCFAGLEFYGWRKVRRRPVLLRRDRRDRYHHHQRWKKELHGPAQAPRN